MNCLADCFKKFKMVASFGKNFKLWALKVNIPTNTTWNTKSLGRNMNQSIANENTKKEITYEFKTKQVSRFLFVDSTFFEHFWNSI